MVRHSFRSVAPHAALGARDSDALGADCGSHSVWDPNTLPATSFRI